MHKNIHRFPENLYKSNNIISFFNQYFKYLLELVLSHDIFVIINLLKNGNSFQKKKKKPINNIHISQIFPLFPIHLTDLLTVFLKYSTIIR